MLTASLQVRLEWEQLFRPTEGRPDASPAGAYSWSHQSLESLSRTPNLSISNSSNEFLNL